MSNFRVKKLDWHKDAAGDFEADTPFGRYTAWRYSWGWDVEFNFESVSGSFDSADEAKAAAQKHYETRVLSALEASQ